MTTGLQQSRIMRDETRARRSQREDVPRLQELEALRAETAKVPAREQAVPRRAEAAFVRENADELLSELGREGRAACEQIDAAIEDLRAAGRHWEAVAREWPSIAEAIFSASVPARNVPSSWRLPTNPVRIFLERLPGRKQRALLVSDDDDVANDVPLPAPPALAAQLGDPDRETFDLEPDLVGGALVKQ